MCGAESFQIQQCDSDTCQQCTGEILHHKLTPLYGSLFIFIRNQAENFAYYNNDNHKSVGVYIGENLADQYACGEKGHCEEQPGAHGGQIGMFLFLWAVGFISLHQTAVPIEGWK